MNDAMVFTDLLYERIPLLVMGPASGTDACYIYICPSFFLAFIEANNPEHPDELAKNEDTSGK